MRPRFLFVYAATAWALGCTLLSGAGDLGVDDPNGSPLDGSANGEGGSGGDGSTTGDAGTDGTTTSKTRLKNITFEDNALTHPITGVDAFTGSVGLQAGLVGQFAARTSGAAFVDETFDPQKTLYISALVRVDVIAPPQLIGTIRMGNGSTVELHVTGAGPYDLELRYGGSSVSSGVSILLGAPYRIGIRFRTTPTPSIRIQSAPKGQQLPNGSSTGGSSLGGTVVGVTFGARGDAGATTMTLDNIRLDSAEMPEE